MWWIVALLVVAGLLASLFAETLPDLAREAGQAAGKANHRVRFWIHAIAIAACGGIVLGAVVYCVTKMR